MFFSNPNMPLIYLHRVQPLNQELYSHFLSTLELPKIILFMTYKDFINFACIFPFEL